MIVHAGAGVWSPIPGTQILCGGMKVEKDVDNNIDSPKEGVVKS
jgi:hypothetical protein